MKLRTPLTAASLAATLALAGCATFTGGDLYKPGEPTTTMIVVNASGMPINALTVSKCNAMSHGLNRLASGDYIPNGGRRSFTIGLGCWDVMAGSTSGSAAINQRYQAQSNVIMEVEFGPVR